MQKMQYIRSLGQRPTSIGKDGQWEIPPTKRLSALIVQNAQNLSSQKTQSLPHFSFFFFFF
jgi:hypothetical protein